jgi:GABA permease
VRRYLVVANQTLAGHHLLGWVRGRREAGPCWFYVLVPATVTQQGTTMAAGEARALARRRLAGALARFEAEGASVGGEVGDASPLRAVLHVLRRARFDEIVLSTLPAESRWVADDLPARLAKVTGLPVTHLVAGSGAAGQGFATAG